MKILHVVPYFYPAWSYGGTPRAVYEIAKKQVAQGFSVSVLTTDTLNKSTRLKLFEKVEGIKIYRSKNLSNFMSWKFHFITPININENLFNQKFDVVHLHEVRTLLNYIVINKIKTEKIVISPWGTLPFNNSQILIKRFFDFFLIKSLKQKVNIAIGQNDHEIGVLKGFGIGKKTFLVPLGIDRSFFLNPPNVDMSQKKIGIKNNNRYIFGFLGRFSELKGLKLLLEAAKELNRDKSINFLLVICGRDDGYLDQMLQIIKENELKNIIKIIPPLYGKDRLLLYSAIDCFISLPTVYEETSTTCLEALAMGKPVITTHYAEIPFVKDLTYVKHIDSSIQEAKKAMKNFIENKPKVKKEFILKRFNWDNIAMDLKNIYEQ